MKLRAEPTNSQSIEHSILYKASDAVGNGHNHVGLELVDAQMRRYRPIQSLVFIHEVFTTKGLGLVGFHIFKGKSGCR